MGGLPVEAGWRVRRRFRLVHPRSGRVLASRLQVPRTPLGRALGLMLRSSLEPGGGMWIVPCNGIHTCFMRFPIDVLFLDRHLRVLRARIGLRPWRLAGPVRNAYSVIELPGGTVADLELERGEPMLLERLYSD